MAAFPFFHGGNRQGETTRSAKLGFFFDGLFQFALGVGERVASETEALVVYEGRDNFGSEFRVLKGHLA